MLQCNKLQGNDLANVELKAKANSYHSVLLHSWINFFQSGTCTLREAIIVSSIMAKNSIPMLHSAAAILKIAEMNYSGANSIFLRTLLDKKYALPYRVVDAVVFHFLGWVLLGNFIDSWWVLRSAVFNYFSHSVAGSDQTNASCLCCGIRACWHLSSVTKEISLLSRKKAWLNSYVFTSIQTLLQKSGESWSTPNAETLKQHSLQNLWWMMINKSQSISFSSFVNIHSYKNKPLLDPSTLSLPCSISCTLQHSFLLNCAC